MEKLTSSHFCFYFNFLYSPWSSSVFQKITIIISNWRRSVKYRYKHDVWKHFLLHKKKVFRKTQELVHWASNIGEILPIITSVCHLVCVQNHCYCMQISRYHINTLLSRQFPHLHGQTGVSNIQSNFILFFFSKCKLDSHTCLNFWPSLDTYSFFSIASAFLHFILTAHYLYSFSRSLLLVFIFFLLFLLLVYFCTSFLRAFPSHVASTDCASYFQLSIAWGKWDIVPWDISEVLVRFLESPGLPSSQQLFHLHLHLQGMWFSFPLLRSTSPL